MRNLIIAHFFLMREFKLFGQHLKVVRAATPIVFAFFVSVFLQTLTDGHWLVTLLCWVPFALCIYLGFFYQKKHPLKYAELEDWNQQYQYLHKPDMIGLKDDTYPQGEYFTSEYRRLAEIHAKYFKNENVDVLKGLDPTWITAIGVLLFIWLN